MKQGRVHISHDGFERFTEFISEGDLSLEERAAYHHAIDQKNVGSIILPVHHYDTIGEFSRYQSRLSPQVSEVMFTCPLTVQEVFKSGALPFALRLSDGSNSLMLEDDYTPHAIVHPNYNVEYFEFIDPIFGSRVGDQVRIDIATYVRPGVISVNPSWFLRNDNQYERAQRSRFKSWMVDIQEWMDI